MVNVSVGRPVRPTLAIGLMLLLTNAAAACDIAQPAATAGPSSEVAATHPVATATAAGLPDLGLTNVALETAAARSTLITPDGGTLTATGANGASYSLTLPKGAVREATQISIYPVSSLSNLPPGGSLSAGVQFAPDGLHLHRRATLSITLPAGVDTGTVETLAWSGDAVRLQRYPALVAGQTLTIGIRHFSGAGVAPVTAPPPAGLVCAPTDFPCRTLVYQTSLATVSGTRNSRANMLDLLGLWYSDLVFDASSESFTAASVQPPVPLAEEDFIDVYDAWLDGIDYARERLNDPTLNVPQLEGSERLATAVLKAWFDAENQICRSEKQNPNLAVPLFWANAAIEDAEVNAEDWGYDRVSDGLDASTLLTKLCVRVVIRGIQFSAALPGDAGNLAVNVGFQFDQDPVRTAPNAIRVIASTGSTQFLNQDADAAGSVSTTATWPAGVDPLTISIQAQMTVDAGGHEVLTLINDFQELVKHGERLAWTFDRGLDGWSRGGAGPEGSGNWGVVDWLSIGGNGVVHMDGRGNPSRANSWIHKSFDLPDATKTLSFDVSAELIKGSSSFVRVRVVAGGVSTPMAWITLHNATNHLSFSRVTVNISQWAGRHVTIYIEQNDNTPAGGVGFDKEIYVDNVKIAT